MKRARTWSLGFLSSFRLRYARWSPRNNQTLIGIQSPLYFPDDSEVEVSIWRQTDDRKVWYEWLVETFVMVGPKKRLRLGVSEMGSSRKQGCLMWRLSRVSCACLQRTARYLTGETERGGFYVYRCHSKLNETCFLTPPSDIPVKCWPLIVTSSAHDRQHAEKISHYAQTGNRTPFAKLFSFLHPRISVSPFPLLWFAPEIHNTLLHLPSWSANAHLLLLPVTSAARQLLSVLDLT